MHYLSPLLIVITILPAATLEAGKFNRQLSIGDHAPDWSDLPGTDGESHSLSDQKSKLLVLIFTCNQCPVASAYQARLKALMAEFASQSIDWVAINGNRGQGETLAKMTQRLMKAKLSLPYLKDENQAVVKSYGVRTTPTVFLLDSERRIVYMGTIDDNPKDVSKVEHHYLRDAIQAVLDGNVPEVTETRSSGCVISLADDN